MAKLTDLINEVLVPQESNFETQKLLDLVDAQLAEDHNTFKQLGFKNNEIIDIYDKREASMFFNETSKIYGKGSYNTEDLKVIAIAYNLRLLRTNRFKGKVPYNITSEIQKFCTRHKIDVDSHLSKNFYVLGPEENFMLEEVQRPKPIDPVLLYKIQKDEYIPVVQWGKELTFFRYLKSISKRSTAHRSISLWFKATTFIYLFIGLFVGFGTFFVLPILISVLGGMGILLIITENTSRWEGTKTLWNENLTRKGYRNE